MTILTLIIPYSILIFYIRSVEKSLTIYLSIILVSFVIYSLLQNNWLSILIYIGLFIAIIIIYKLKDSRRNMIKITYIKITDVVYISIVISLCVVSYFIPINQNWDFYTFYYQIIYSTVAQSIAPLFNNVQLMILILLKDFEILPRIVAIFFLINFLLLLNSLFNKNLTFSLLIITNLSIYISLINEDSYLELSSLTVLTLFLVNYYRHGLNNIYTKLSGILLFFTKGNVSFVIGPYVNLLLLVHTIVEIYKQNKKTVIYNLIYLFLFGLATIYFINNYLKYYAINFEVFFMFQFLTMKVLKSATWLTIVSGSTQMSLFQLIHIKLYNLLNPIYNIFIVLSLIIIANKHIKLAQENLHFSKFEIGLLSVYLIYILSPYFPAINTFSNIFVIRYYIFFIFIIFVIFLRKLNVRDSMFYTFIAILSLFFYVINIIESGPFMKEKLIINYSHGLYIYHMLTIGIFLLVISFLRLYTENYKINSILQLVLYLSVLITSIVLISFVYPLVINAYSLKFFTDSTQYNCLLNDLYPKLYVDYNRSYCENDMILINISRICHYVYSIGGIYAPSALLISNITVLIRAGHISFLPFILDDIKLNNLTSYYYILKKYPYLKTFELPSNFCFQIVSQNHKEYGFIETIKMLNQTSKSFSIIYNNITKNPKFLRIYHYYVVYNVVNPLNSSQVK